MDEVKDTLAIQKLVALYNVAWDTNQAADVAECFTEAGIFQDVTGTEHEGRSAIMAFVRQSQQTFGAMRHLTSSHLVGFTSPDEARHTCYMLFVSHPSQGERRLDVGSYADAVARTPDGWRFTRREIRFDA